MSIQPRFVKVFVIALCTGAVFTTDAWAGFNAKTSLSINARGQVDAGETFYISGHLTSSKTHCRAHKTVKLIKEGHGVVETDETTQLGKYSFGVSINHTRKFHTRFTGLVTGGFPNAKVCRASSSEKVTVLTT